MAALRRAVSFNSGIQGGLLGLARLLGMLLCAAAFALSPGCDDQVKADEKHERVTIKGKSYRLELAADDEKRIQGLSGREEIKPDEGMLFVFPRPQRLEFVMRDCPIPIDIIFLDASGRVTATHKMVPEEPRRDDEPKPAAPGGDDKYENRLKRYGSRHDAQYVIELAGNTLDSLALKVGDRIALDTAKLKKLVK